MLNNVLSVAVAAGIALLLVGGGTSIEMALLDGAVIGIFCALLDIGRYLQKTQ